MERIVFEGGDMDGETEDYEVGEDTLRYDGSGGRAFPRGTYFKTGDSLLVDGVLRSVWRIVR